MTPERIHSLVPSRRLLLAMSALAALPFAAGCGGEERQAGTGTGATGTAAREQPPPRGKPVASVTISEVDFRLRPATVTIDRPGIVEFTAKNDGQAPHALEVEGPKGEAETKVLQAGQSEKLKVDLTRPSSNVIYRPVGNDREMGMVGRVRVARGRPGGGGGASGGGSGGGGAPGGGGGGAGY